MTNHRIAIGARVRVLKAAFVDLSKEETFGVVTSNTETWGGQTSGHLHPYKVNLEPGLTSKSNAGCEIWAYGLEVVPEPKRVLLPRPTVRERDGLLAEIAELEKGLREAIAEVDRATEWMTGERETLMKRAAAADATLDTLRSQMAAKETEVSEVRASLKKHITLRAYVEGHLLDDSGMDWVKGFTHGYTAGRA